MSSAVSAASAQRWPPAEPPVMQTNDRVGAVLGAVLAHPGDRPLDVDQVVGEGRARAEPVVDVEADPAVVGEVVEQRDALLVAGAGDPAAAVDLDDRRSRLVRRRAGRHVDVEAQGPGAVAGELDPAHAPHARAARASAAAAAGGCAGSRERRSSAGGSSSASASRTLRALPSACQAKRARTSTAAPSSDDEGDADRALERAEPDRQRDRRQWAERDRERELAQRRARHPAQQPQSQRARRAHREGFADQPDQAASKATAWLARLRRPRRPRSRTR